MMSFACVSIPSDRIVAACDDMVVSGDARQPTIRANITARILNPPRQVKTAVDDRDYVGSVSPWADGVSQFRS